MSAKNTSASPRELVREVEDETDRLDRSDQSPPCGGFRNRAVEAVAARHGLNPYALDRVIGTA